MCLTKTESYITQYIAYLQVLFKKKLRLNNVRINIIVRCIVETIFE